MSRSLPPGVAPWGPELSGLVPEAVASVQSWLGPLDQLTGELGRADAEPAAFDGYEGVSRRGPYHRLLLSAWVLAEEVPDEFLRRAVDHEHQFLQPAAERSRRQGLTVVLLDAGPLQWGCPRLLQLAFLIVLGRRVRAGGGQVAWGTLQSSSSGLQQSLSAASLRAWSHRRATEVVPLSALEDWALVLRKQQKVDDVWVVSGSASVEQSVVRGVFGPSSAHLLVTDEDALGPPRRVNVALSRRDGPRKTLSLARPPHDAAATALRDPTAGELRFTRGASSSVTPGRARFRLIAPHAFRFSPAATRLLMVLDGGVVRSTVIPQAPRPEGVPHATPRFVEARVPRGTVVAALWRKGLVIVTHHEGALWLQVGGRSPQRLAPDVPFATERGGLCPFVYRPQNHRYILGDGHERVFILDPSSGRVTPFPHRCIDVLPVANKMLALVRDADGDRLVLDLEEGALERAVKIPQACKLIHLRPSDSLPGLLSPGKEGELLWRPSSLSHVSLSPEKTLSLPEGVGPLAAAPGRRLWALAEDRRRLLLLHLLPSEQVGPRVVRDFTQPVFHMRVNDSGRLCAFLEEDALRVVDLEGKVVHQIAVDVE